MKRFVSPRSKAKNKASEALATPTIITGPHAHETTPTNGNHQLQPDRLLVHRQQQPERLVGIQTTNDNNYQLQPDRLADALALLAAAPKNKVQTRQQPERLLNASPKLNGKFVRRATCDSDPFEKSQQSPPQTSTSTSTKYDELKHKIDFLAEMVLGYDLLFVLLASTALTILVDYVGAENKWLSYLTSSSSAVGTLGALFSFALVFRTNICYARWWEGRTLWGTIIVTSIRICQQSRLWIHDEQLNDRIDCLAITFPFACKAILRGNSIDDEEEDGLALVSRGILAYEELDVIKKGNAWQPYYCIDALRATVNEGLVRTEHKISYDGRKNAAHTAMEDTITGLANAIGGCIRVRSTGLPVAYDTILNAIGYIFFSCACIAWAPGAMYYNPILVLTIYIAIKMIVGVGNDMEDPFGNDESDLPLESYCATIESQINAIEERRAVKYDLAYGPTDNKGEYAVNIARESMTGSLTSSFINKIKDGDVELGQSGQMDNPFDISCGNMSTLTESTPLMNKKS